MFGARHSLECNCTGCACPPRAVLQDSLKQQKAERAALSQELDETRSKYLELQARETDAATHVKQLEAAGEEQEKNMRNHAETTSKCEMENVALTKDLEAAKEKLVTFEKQKKVDLAETQLMCAEFEKQKLELASAKSSLADLEKKLAQKDVKLQSVAQGASVTTTANEAFPAHTIRLPTHGSNWAEGTNSAAETSDWERIQTSDPAVSIKRQPDPGDEPDHGKKFRRSDHASNAKLRDGPTMSRTLKSTDLNPHARKISTPRSASTPRSTSTPRSNSTPRSTSTPQATRHLSKPQVHNSPSGYLAKKKVSIQNKPTSVNVHPLNPSARKTPRVAKQCGVSTPRSAYSRNARKTSKSAAVNADAFDFDDANATQNVTPAGQRRQHSSRLTFAERSTRPATKHPSQTPRRKTPAIAGLAHRKQHRSRARLGDAVTEPADHTESDATDIFS